MKKVFLILLVLALPLSIFTKWKDLDNSYPTDDESGYCELSQEFYLNFKNENTSTAVGELYWHKHWRPILHPLLLVPVLTLTKGDTRAAIRLYSGVLYALLLIISFLFLSRYLEKEMSVLGAISISLLPWVFGISTTFNSEIAFVVGGLGLFFVFYDQDEFQSLNRCVLASLLLALIFCCRPVETVLLTTVGLTYFIKRSYQKQKINIRDLYCLLTFGIFFLLVVILPFFYLKRGWSLTETVFIIALALFYCVFLLSAIPKFKLNRNFQIFFGVFFLLSIVWYTPGAFQLLDWIFVANFDYHAKETGNRLNTTLLSFLAFYMQKLGFLPVVLGLIYGVDNRKSLKSLFSEKAIVIVCGFIVFPLLGGIISYNGDVRYYYLGWIILTLALFSQFFQKDRTYYWLRYILMAFIFSLTLFNIYLHIHLGGVIYPFPKVHLLTGESFHQLAPKNEEPYISIQQSLASEVQRLNKPNSNVLILQTMASPFLDASTLNIISREKSEALRFANMSYYNEIDLLQVYASLNRHFEYIIVGPADIPANEAKLAPAIIAHELVTACNAGTRLTNPNLSNFRLVKALSFKETKVKFGIHCLFENSKLIEKKSSRFH